MEETNDSSLLDLDGKACCECVRLVFEEYNERINDHLFMIHGYSDPKVLESASTKVSSDFNVEKNKELLEKLVEEESKLDAELAEVEAELEELENEEKEVMQKELNLQLKHQVIRDEDVVIRGMLYNVIEKLSSWNAHRDDSLKRLEMLCSYRVHEDLFCISKEGEFPVINGLRLGSLPSIPVEWEEINCSVGECCLLLHVCGTKLNYLFKTFRPLPNGDASSMLRVATKEVLPLSGSFMTAVMSSQFNIALGSLLTATDEIVQAVCRLYGYQSPYKVAKDMIGDKKGNWFSVKRPIRDSSTWVRALLYLLAELKWLLALVVAADLKEQSNKRSDK